MNLVEVMNEYKVEAADGFYDCSVTALSSACAAMASALIAEAGLDMDVQNIHASEGWMLQALADLANAAAKSVDYAHYQLKDELLEIMTQVMTPALSFDWSWGMPHVTCTTPEWGVSSFHAPDMFMTEWDQLPAATSWSGVRRQMASMAIAKKPRLRKVVAYATLNPSPEIAVRVNAILERHAF